jgi:hypothetical protein
MQTKSLVLTALFAAAACATPHRHGAGDDDGTADAPSGVAQEICNNGIDDNGDGLIDCADPQCSGIDGCPMCGEVDNPQATPLPLPDTNLGDENPKCTTNANCAASSPNCIITADTDDGPGLCAISYVDTLNFVGFNPGATLDDTSKLIQVCATMEHSWLGDLQIELISPDGKTVALRQFVGRTVGEFFLGHANDCDDDDNPVPGVGYQYCWTATATNKLLNATNDDCGAAGGCETWSDTACDGPHQVLPAGNYLPDTPFTGLQGAQLNGNWTFRATDLWAIDNGYLFDWSIQFDSSLVADCSVPIIQ